MKAKQRRKRGGTDSSGLAVSGESRVTSQVWRVWNQHFYIHTRVSVGTSTHSTALRVVRTSEQQQPQQQQQHGGREGGDG